MASPHWFATMFAMAVFWYVLREPVGTERRAAVAGALTVLVGLTRQPAGVAVGVAVSIVVLRDVWVGRRIVPPASALGRLLTAYAAGALGLLAPILLAFVVVAGYGRVVEALVLVPLGPYRNQPFVRDSTRAEAVASRASVRSERLTQR
jgi:hypothetical protein